MVMAEVSVVFDFDGTIALGQGPLDAYARCVGELAGEAEIGVQRVVGHGSRVPSLGLDPWHSSSALAESGEQPLQRIES